jgi:hypothetical protein
MHFCYRAPPSRRACSFRAALDRDQLASCLFNSSRGSLHSIPHTGLGFDIFGTMAYSQPIL